MRKHLLGSFALALVFLFAQTSVVKSAGEVIYCYWGTWSSYRPGNGKFEVGNIDPNLCTHIGYAFFGLGDNDQIRSLDTWLDFDLGTVAKTIALKQRNPKLKVLASIGGWSEGSTKYSAMASSPARRSTFINSVVQFLGQHGFDGLDFDWEYPVQRGGSPSDRANFVTLLRELKAAFRARNYLLTVAVAAGEESASISYDISNFSQHVDLINVMTYDFSGSWDSKTGFNAPLQGIGGNNDKAAISYWLRSGAPASKIVLGVPFYGRSFTLANANQNTPGSPATGPGRAGPITGEAGYLGYNEICQNLKDGYTRRWDAAELVPYAFKGSDWFGYDDTESIGYKIDYLKSLNLAGAMVWSLETDDFRGSCGESFPLLRSINRGLGNNVGSGPTQAPPVTSAPTSAPTSGPSNENCRQDGFYANPGDCRRFYQCSNGYRYDFECTDGLLFDTTTNTCNWANLVNCK